MKSLQEILGYKTAKNKVTFWDAWHVVILIAFAVCLMFALLGCKKEEETPICKSCTEVFIDNLDNGIVQRYEKGSKTYCNGEWVEWENKVRDEHSPPGHNAKTIWECK